MPPFVQISENIPKLERICEISSKISPPFKEQSCWNSSANNCCQIQVLNFSANNYTCNVNVKFSHDNLNTVGNHYDAITLISKSRKTKDKTEGRSVPTFKKPIIKTKMGEPKKTFSQQYIDLMDEDMHQPKLHGNSIDYNRTSLTESWSDETYISSDGTSERSTRPNSEPGTSSGYPYSDTEEITTETSGDENTKAYNMEVLSVTTFSTIKQQALAEAVSQGRPFPMWIFDDKIPEEVTQVPVDIDDLSYFKIHVKDHKWHQPTSDKSHFKIMMSSHDGFLGEQ